MKKSQASNSSVTQQPKDRDAVDRVVSIEVAITPNDLRHGYRIDMEVQHSDVFVVHGMRMALEENATRLRNGRIVNSNPDVIRWLIEQFADAYRAGNS